MIFSTQSTTSFPIRAKKREENTNVKRGWRNTPVPAPASIAAATPASFPAAGSAATTPGSTPAPSVTISALLTFALPPLAVFSLLLPLATLLSLPFYLAVSLFLFSLFLQLLLLHLRFNLHLSRGDRKIIQFNRGFWAEELKSHTAHMLSTQLSHCTVLTGGMHKDSSLMVGVWFQGWNEHSLPHLTATNNHYYPSTSMY